ncbi:MAG TPA: NAD(P)-dependent oxidoreductase [Alphaproteobacteria bacterium]|jgi:UDP-glucose 4-epimerase
MTTLVTGAGLIGASFAEWAAKRGERVVFLDPEPRADFLRAKLGDESDYQLVRADVRDLPAIVAAIQAHKVDTVVHSAGLIGARVEASLYMGLQVNLMGTMNVAEAVRLAGVRRLVHISTFGVYDTRREIAGPLKEDFPRGGVGRGYANSKVAKELILEAYKNMYGFELVVLRPANVYGLGHFWSGSSGGEKMQALLEAGVMGVPARLRMSDTIANEYIYAKDVGRAVDLAATAAAPKQTAFNIGNGVVDSFEQVAAAVRKLLPGLTVEVEPGDAGKSKSQPLDISAAKAHLGWAPAYSLEAGFADYLADLRAIGPGAKARLSGQGR